MRLSLVLLAIAAVPVIALAQDRLPTLPGYAEYQQLVAKEQGAGGGRAGGGGRGGGRGGAVFQSGALTVEWAADGKRFNYTIDTTRYVYDIATRTASVATAAAPAAVRTGVGRGRGGVGGAGGFGRGAPASGAADLTALMQACGLATSIQRGRQAAGEASPDGKLLAFYRNRNLYVISSADATCGHPTAITTDGSEKTRVKYGTASWVYGEELEQREAFGWSPDGTKLWYFRFDESGIPDYYIQASQTKIQDTIDVEAYPKPGVPNPVVDLFVYDMTAKRSTRIDVRDGKPMSNDVVGHYVYDIRWSPDGKEITLNRKNRRQNILEFAACSPSTAKCRVIVHDEWPTGWLENHDEASDMQYLSDGKRFIWKSVRNGFDNYYLYDWSGNLLATLTSLQADVLNIERVDERAGVMFYTARDGDNFMKTQFHRVNLDGTGDTRLTDPAFTHRIEPSPDWTHFVDVAETHDQPPVTRLLDANGAVVATLAKSDLARFEQIGLKKVEMFTYLAADGKTTLYGTIAFPTYFDPTKKYPVLLSVYGGPAFSDNVPTENFAVPSATTDYGFLVVSLHTRSSLGMPKRVLDEVYLKLGVTEIDDMAAGIKALWTRPYVDKANVGIYGTSYGGYAAAMAILRYPDVFAAASAASPPTDWRNYDTIYTERYMWIPEENKAGYDAGSAMTYANNLKGALLLYYGTYDNNVHPANSLQLIQALQAARKHFEVQLGPDLMHSAVNNARMMEFFIQNLKMHLVANGN